MQEMADMAAGEKQMSIATSSMFPGFRFTPTDLELISHYLKKKLEGTDNCVEVIPEVEICQYEPWDLPAKSVIQSENEWFFFSPRGRKYPNGSQSKRATESGYWKATGKERNVKSGSNLIGTKRTLVFHMGRAPRGERTEWIMHEYCMRGQPQDSWVVCRIRKNSQFRSNDSPRQGSLNRRNLSTENNSTFSLSEAGVEQSGIFEGTGAVESNSKGLSSSYNSHSVEQQCDYESESDQKLTSNYSQPGPSHQGCEDEDCYADILKDDIVDLGKSLMPPTTPDPLSISYQPAQAIPSRTLPSQGTASRRIRLGMPKVLEKYHGQQPEDELRDNYFVDESVHPSSLCSLKSMLNLVSERRVNRRVMRYCIFLLIVLILMVLSLSFLGHVRRLLYASLA